MIRTCPTCRTELRTQTPVTPTDKIRTPEPGDASVCSQCRSIAVYTEDGFRLPTDDELKKLLQLAEVQAAIFAVGQMHRMGMLPQKETHE